MERPPLRGQWSEGLTQAFVTLGGREGMDRATGEIPVSPVVPPQLSSRR